MTVATRNIIVTRLIRCQGLEMFEAYVEGVLIATRWSESGARQAAGLYIAKLGRFQR